MVDCYGVRVETNLHLVQGFMREEERSRAFRMRSFVTQCCRRAAFYIRTSSTTTRAAQLVGAGVNDGNLATDSPHGISVFYQIPSVSLIRYTDPKIYRVSGNGSSDRQKRNQLENGFKLWDVSSSFLLFAN